MLDASASHHAYVLIPPGHGLWSRYAEGLYAGAGFMVMSLCLLLQHMYNLSTEKN